MIKLIKILIIFIVATYMVPLSSYSTERTKKDLSILKKKYTDEVFIVSKKAEDPFKAAASVYVLTREDIKESGATSIQDALRMVPGIQVATVGSNWYAVSARGFNDTIANKLLVMIDGRTIYNTLFSGVWWDEQDILMEDIKQIEIIRGPGATLHGANAVNGIINIITEDAANTLEKMVTYTYGNDRQTAATRVGGTLSEDAHYRIYAKHSIYDSMDDVTGVDAKDAWDTGIFGFRVDLDKSDRDSITIQGNGYNSNIDRTANLAILTAPFSQETVDNSNVFGGNLLAKWDKTLEDGSTASLQTYVDHTERNFSVSRENRSVFDIDVQHNLNPKGIHSITWGSAYRFVHDREPYTFYFPYLPTDSYDSLYSMFIQDEISVTDTVEITLGSKFEHHKRSGFEFQPSVRVAWTPTTKQTLWGSVSRAIRSPSRFENDGNQVLGVIPGLGYIRWEENKNFNSEELLAYEIGYRIRPTSNIDLDFSTFYNEYDNLKTQEPLAAFSTDPTTVLPLYLDNKGSAQSYGVEFSSTYAINKKWKLTGGYSFLVIETDVSADSSDTSLVNEESKSPQHQFNIRSSMNLTDKLEFNNAFYYVSSLDVLGIPEYSRFDSNITWKAHKGLELSLVGQNLLDDGHTEFASIPVLPDTEVGRSVYAKATWRF